MTIHITWHAVWSVAKYVLTFGAGVVVGVAVMAKAIGDSIGRAF